MPNQTNIVGTATAAAAVSASAGVAAQALPPLGPKSTGVPGPGDVSAGNIDFTKTGVKGPETFDTFGCKVFRENSKTPDFVTANVYFERQAFLDGDLVMPDGRQLRHWGFEDPLRAPGQKSLPSPLIRVQEGDLVHTKFSARTSSHTIHHHGIEPTTMNDGVGHTSFEVTGSYIYQWQPTEPGTYFYHCHKNTVLHFKMGMYGLLIVDPKPNANGKVPAFAGGPEYDVEKFWVLDDIDPRYQELNHDAGLCGEDVGLNIFKPRYFLITGTPTRPTVPTDAQRIFANPGQKILIRLLNASYSVIKVTIEGLAATIIGVDGNALNEPWNAPLTIPPGQPFFLTTAQRRMLLINTASGPRGTHRVTFEFQDWITRRRHNAGQGLYEGFAFTTISI
ncbi:multicopper oxidase domain-containing protein [Methylobacterium segetis]|uniref:multicopper oxidase domain-containing protein n=1 Tax=Methylobacterium segetis TaxID=2488750 RepID=UPI001404B920|nr:multicopper oxidase domain-containing protein [Methylobacterium segetis]